MKKIICPYCENDSQMRIYPAQDTTIAYRKNQKITWFWCEDCDGIFEVQ